MWIPLSFARASGFRPEVQDQSQPVVDFNRAYRHGNNFAGLVALLDATEDGHIENLTEIANETWVVSLATRFRYDAVRLRALQA